MVLSGSKQSRAIVLNRFGLALIGRIAPDRSDAEYVRRTRSTKRLNDNRFILQEIAARRLQAVLRSIRSGKTARESAIALQHAQLVSDLTGSENWYSELVLGMALNATGNSIEAQAKAEHARSLAKDENVALCDTFLAWIETKEPIEWKFLR